VLKHAERDGLLVLDRWVVVTKFSKEVCQGDVLEVLLIELRI
jgi:hypothetical protein